MRIAQALILFQILTTGLVLGKPVAKRSTSASTTNTTKSTTSTTSYKISSKTNSKTFTISKTSSKSSLTHSSRTSSASAVTPTYVKSAGSYSYAGCAAEPFYNGITGVRALTGISATTNAMTVEYCANFCSGYEYFGVEYASQCFCGNSLSYGTSLDSLLADCTAVCAGNSGEYCGGSGHLNLYQMPNGSASSLPKTWKTSATPSATSTGSARSSGLATSTTATITGTMSAVPSASGYSFVGCAIEPFENNVNSRALTGAATTSSNSMTVEACAAYCGTLSYTFFGVEYASQCYCGNTVISGTTLDTNRGCNMACTGNPLEQCGGSGRLNLYELSSQPVITLPITYFSPATTSSAPVSPSTSVITSTPSASTSTSITSTSSTSSSSTTATTSSSSSSIATSTSSSTIFATSTSSTTSSASTPSATAAQFNVKGCSSITKHFGGSSGTYNYTLYTSPTLSGTMENTNNPGNVNWQKYPAVIYNVDGSQTVCQAVQSCINEISWLTTVYKSLDLHYRTDTGIWECILYSGANTQASFFNVPTSYVSRAYGFSGILS